MWYIQLRNYAEWYYTKYFPSCRTLREKLVRKCEDAELVDRVMTDLSPLFVEDKIIESRVHAYVGQGKTTRAIRQKLLEKKYDPVMVDAALTLEVDTLTNPETFRPQIERLIQKGIQKWTAKKILQYELQMKYPEAKRLVSELLIEYDDREILIKKAPELLKKYTQEQIVTKLCQKGFNLSEIYTVLRRR